MLGSPRRQQLRPIDKLTPAIARSFKGGLNTHDPDTNMAPGFLTEVRNMFPDPSGVLRVRYGTTFFADVGTYGGTVVNMEYFINALIVVLSNGVVVKVDAAGIHAPIWNSTIAASRPNSPAPWGPTDFVSFAQFGGQLVLCNGRDKPLVIDSAMSVNYLADVGSGSNVNVPRARYVVTHNNYLIMAATPTDKTTLYITNKGTNGTFAGDPAPNDAVNVNTAAYVMSGLPEITGLGSFRDRLIVCYDELILSVKLGTYNGDAHVPDVTDVVENHGAVSHRTIVPMGDDVLFMDKVGVSSVSRALITATLSPTRESTLVGRDMQRLLSRFSVEDMTTSLWAMHDRIAQQVLFFIPQATIGGIVQMPDPTTLNPADKSAAITLSNNNLTATNGAQNGLEERFVRSTYGATDGKRYWQVKAPVEGPDSNMRYGICQANSTFGGSNGVTFSALVHNTGGTFQIVGNAPLASYPSMVGPVQGTDYVEFAVDFDTKQLWARRLNAAGNPYGNWNGAVGANPATGAGGIYFGAHLDTGPFHAVLHFAFYDSAQRSMTFNFGDSAYVGAGAPAGFQALGQGEDVELPNSVAADADNDVYVYCVDKSQKFRAFTYFNDMPYRCGTRTPDGRIFLAGLSRIYYYRNQFEPIHVDFAERAAQPWDDDMRFDDMTAWDEPGLRGTYDGSPIVFSATTPWSDMRMPEQQKDARYLHCVMEGAGAVVVEQYNDRFAQLQLQMRFNMTAEPQTPEQIYRPLNNDQLYAWNCKFTRAKLRVHGQTKQQLALVSLGLLYLPGGYRR